jgi:hypothetical protein
MWYTCVTFPQPRFKLKGLVRRHIFYVLCVSRFLPLISHVFLGVDLPGCLLLRDCQDDDETVYVQATGGREGTGNTSSLPVDAMVEGE